ncbi:hypothetical protein J6590_091720 [Homalodisca vitripennis]|nr:hypothetical protein J6590_091720 [Homalodisca vitripennis]
MTNNWLSSFGTASFLETLIVIASSLGRPLNGGGVLLPRANSSPPWRVGGEFLGIQRQASASTVIPVGYQSLADLDRLVIVPSIVPSTVSEP